MCLFFEETACVSQVCVNHHFFVSLSTAENKLEFSFIQILWWLCVDLP